MLSSDNNIDNISDLILEIKNYISIKSQCLQTDFVSKLTQLMTVLVLGAILFLLGAVAIIFISMMAAAFLSPYVGGEAESYAIIVVVYLLLASIIYSKRKTWIESPIANFLGHLFLNEKDRSGLKI